MTALETKKLIKTAKFIIRNAKKLASGNMSMHGSWIASNGKQYVCDSHQILEINNPVDIPVADTASHMDCEKIVVNAKKDNTYTLDIPSLNDMKKQIEKMKSEKKGKRILFCFGNNQPTLNAEYLYRMSEALGCNVLHINKDKPEKNPVYIENDIGTALMLPCENRERKVGWFYAN